MTRMLVDARIQDRSSRNRLAVRNKPYWRALSEGAHIGYRRGKRKGTWFARYLCTGGASYVTSALGEADDGRDADGQKILNCKQAFDAAVHWIDLYARGEPSGSNCDMTVGDAVRAYVDVREARRANQAGWATHSDAYYSLNRYVIEGGRLSAVKLADLSEADLRAWQRRTARTKHSSIQRLVNDLKAALNAAFEAHRRVLPPDLPATMKYGLKVAAPDTIIGAARDNQILTTRYAGSSLPRPRSTTISAIWSSCSRRPARAFLSLCG